MFELTAEEKGCLDTLNGVLKPEGVELLAYDYETQGKPVSAPYNTYNLRVNRSLLGSYARVSDVFRVISEAGTALRPKTHDGDSFIAEWESRQARQDCLRDLSQKIRPAPHL